MSDEEFKLRLLGFRPTTAEIVYRMPDFPDLLQTFVWQQLDRAPEYPRLKRFLAYWRKHLDGPLLSVRVAHASGVFSGEVRLARAEYRLH